MLHYILGALYRSSIQQYYVTVYYTCIVRPGLSLYHRFLRCLCSIIQLKTHLGYKQNFNRMSC
jgi:hypothetical protein